MRFRGTYTMLSCRPIEGRDGSVQFGACWWNKHTIRSTNQKGRFIREQLFAASRPFKNVWMWSVRLVA